MTRWRPPRGDPFVDLADDAAHEAAVRARLEERQLRGRSAELADWTGTLRDLAERAAPVVLATALPRTHRGRLVAVADDHVVLRSAAGPLVAVRTSAVTTVRPEPGRPGGPATGDREAAQDRTLLELLDRAAAEREEVALAVTGAPDPLRGVLLAVGEDVVTLRLGGEQGTCYVRAGAVLEAVLEGGGPTG